jgi:hypothetical protein
VPHLGLGCLCDVVSTRTVAAPLHRAVKGQAVGNNWHASRRAHGLSPGGAGAKPLHVHHVLTPAPLLMQREPFRFPPHLPPAQYARSRGVMLLPVLPRAPGACWRPGLRSRDRSRRATTPAACPPAALRPTHAPHPTRRARPSHPDALTPHARPAAQSRAKPRDAARCQSIAREAPPRSATPRHGPPRPATACHADRRDPLRAVIRVVRATVCIAAVASNEAAQPRRMPDAHLLGVRGRSPCTRIQSWPSRRCSCRGNLSGSLRTSLRSKAHAHSASCSSQCSLARGACLGVLRHAVCGVAC